MTSLPNPFDSGATDCPPDKAAASLRQVDGAAVEFMESSAAVAQDAVNVLVAGSNPASPATDCIGEIFVGARKLNLPPFQLDVEQFMADIEEPPMFLRAVGY